MGTFWLNFVITEAVSVAEAFLATSNLKPGLKAALETLVKDGQNVVSAIQNKA